MDEAIGAFEAAALLGVHFTKPMRMWERGEISARELAGDDSRRFVVYSRRDCDQNYADYESAERTGRPRTRVADRPLAQRRLAAKGVPKIAFGDAIGAKEAAEILGVWYSLIPRLAREKKIVGRILWSERAGGPKLWIFSRESVERRAAESRKLEGAGQKVGRPRTALQKKKRK